MKSFSQDILVSILCELSDYRLLIRCTSVCKEWQFVVRNKGLWSSAALRKISQCLDAIDSNMFSGSADPSEDFLHDLTPEVLGLMVSESMHWNQMGCFFSSPKCFRMLFPTALETSDTDFWLERRALALLNAASIAISEPLISSDARISCPLVPSCAIAGRTFLTEVLQPLHLHFWDGTDSNTFSHHVLARAVSVYQLRDENTAAGEAAKQIPVLKCFVFEIDAHLHYCHADVTSLDSTWSLRALRRFVTSTPSDCGVPPQTRTEWVDIASRSGPLTSFPPPPEVEEDDDEDDAEHMWVVRTDSSLATVPLSAAAVAGLVHPLVTRCCRCLCDDRDEPPLPPPGPASAAAARIRARIAAGAAPSVAAAPYLLTSPADVRAAVEFRRALANSAGPVRDLAGRLAYFDWDESDGVLGPFRDEAVEGEDDGVAGRLRRCCFAVSERVGGGGRVAVFRFFALAARWHDDYCLCARMCAAVFSSNCGGNADAAGTAAELGTGGGEGVTVLTLWDGDDTVEGEGRISVKVVKSAVAAVVPIVLGNLEDCCADAQGRSSSSADSSADRDRMRAAMALLVALVRCPGLCLDGRRGRVGLSFQWEVDTGEGDLSTAVPPPSLAPLSLGNDADGAQHCSLE